VIFNFPATIYVETTTVDGQLSHALSEVIEAQAEAEACRQLDCDREAMDALHSLETYFRKRINESGEQYVDDIITWVELKNRVRGYYPVDVQLKNIQQPSSLPSGVEN
jgi:hypothetical protein